MSRPSDSMQPAGKRRPGEQLTKDSADDDDEGPVMDPGTWGKADQATMARRKMVRARRGAAAAEPAAQAADNEAPAAGNPFVGVSLTGAAAPASNPFAGVSLVAAATDSEAGKEAAARPDTEAEPAAAPQETAAANDNASAATIAEPPAAAAEKPPAQPAVADNASQAKPADNEAAAVAKEPAADAAKPAAAAAAADTPAEAGAVNARQADAAEAPAPAAGTGLFGSAAIGGFGALGGTTGGFGSMGGTTAGFGGFGGFAAAAKDGTSGGSLFGSYTAPQPGSLFAPAPAFGAARQSKDGEDNELGVEAEGAEGDAVFGGPEIAPVVQLSEVPKQTGEEEEDGLFAAEGSLFEFVSGKEWRERGKGELRINLHKATHQARLVMRQRGSQRLLLNANLYPNMTTSKMVGGKGVTFAAVNAAAAVVQDGKDKEKEVAEGEGGEEQSADKESKTEAAASSSAAVMRTYALKVKSTERINAFVATVEKYKAGGAAVAAPEAGDDAV